jgi:hypothetical protein
MQVRWPILAMKYLLSTLSQAQSESDSMHKLPTFLSSNIQVEDYNAAALRVRGTIASG